MQIQHGKVLGHLPGALLLVRLEQIGELARHYRAGDHTHGDGISGVRVPYTPD